MTGRLTTGVRHGPIVDDALANLVLGVGRDVGQYIALPARGEVLASAVGRPLSMRPRDIANPADPFA